MDAFLFASNFLSKEAHVPQFSLSIAAHARPVTLRLKFTLFGNDALNFFSVVITVLSGRGRYWIVHLASLVDNEYKMAGVMNVSEGVTKEILREGSGPQVLKGDNITVQCTGSIAEGNKKFWRSVVTDFCLESILYRV